MFLKYIFLSLGFLVLQIGLFTGLAYSATYTVTQSGMTFSPKDITISAGDTIKWQWTAGIHTVTSGTGGLDPDVGKLFDIILNSSNPTFEYAFTNPGVIDYFCRPHEAFGMKGSVTVLSRIPVDTTPLMLLLLLLVSTCIYYYAQNRDIAKLNDFNIEI